jgi:ATP-binding cassette subfamily F protein uup
VGGYDDWVRQRSQQATSTGGRPVVPKPKPEKPKAATGNRMKYAEKRELEMLPERIESLEGSISGLHAAMAEPGFYQQPASVISARQSELKGLEAELAATYQRWEELDMLASEV